MLDTKIKTIDEAKKYAESQFQDIARQNRDLMQRLHDERTEKSQSVLELNAAKRDIHKLRDRLKELSTERETMIKDLRTKEHELANIKIRRYSSGGAVVVDGLRTSSPEKDMMYGHNASNLSISYGQDKSSPTKARPPRINVEEDSNNFGDYSESTTRPLSNIHDSAPLGSPGGSVNSKSVAELIEHYEAKTTAGSTTSGVVPTTPGPTHGHGPTRSMVSAAADVLSESSPNTNNDKENDVAVSSQSLPQEECSNLINGDLNGGTVETSSILQPNRELVVVPSLPLESYTHPTLQASSPSSPQAAIFLATAATQYSTPTTNTNTHTNTHAYPFQQSTVSSIGSSNHTDEKFKYSDMDLHAEHNEVAAYSSMMSERYTPQQAKPSNNRSDYYYGSPETGYPLGYEPPPRMRPSSTTSGMGASPASAHYKPKMTPRSKEALLKHQVQYFTYNIDISMIFENVCWCVSPSVTVSVLYVCLRLSKLCLIPILSCMFV